jgi:hypothetical protein
MKIAIVATSLLLATAIPAFAGHYGSGGDTNWGAVAGAGILGALLGAASQPTVLVAPPPQVIIVVPPAPSTVAPLSERPAWCSGAGRVWRSASRMCVFE